MRFAGGGAVAKRIEVGSLAVGLAKETKKKPTVKYYPEERPNA